MSEILKKFKVVPQLDDENYFTGMSIADESALHPGKYEYAQGAIDVQPPPRQAKQNEAIYWTGSDWLFVPDFRNATIYSIETGQRIENVTKEGDFFVENIKRGQSLKELKATLLKPEPGQLWDEQSQCWTWTLEQLKQMKLAELASLRWQVQCAGVMVGCAEFASSPDDAARLKSAIEDAQLIAEDVVAFKTKNFFLEISIDDLQEAYKKIVRHTQACYRNEKHLASQVNALTEKEDVKAFNLANGWPI